LITSKKLTDNKKCSKNNHNHNMDYKKYGLLSHVLWQQVDKMVYIPPEKGAAPDAKGSIKFL